MSRIYVCQKISQDILRVERIQLGVAGLGLVGGAIAFVSDASLTLSLISLFIGAVSMVLGVKSSGRVNKRIEAIRELVSEKSELEGSLEREQERVDELRTSLEEKEAEQQRLRDQQKRKNQRLQNLKRVLRRKGIDTSYLVDKYDDALYAPVMVLTHFSHPNHNEERGADLISENLEALDAKTLHGATKIIPPRNFDQSTSGRTELRDWFDEEVLSGKTDLAHRLEFLSIVDINQVFDRDQVDDEGGFPTNTVSKLFETDTVVPTEKLLEILAHDEQISIEDELRDNIALLAVSGATQDQMDALFDNQSAIESELGGITQIANTRPVEIGQILSKYEIPDSAELAQAIHEEANQLQEILG